MIKHCLKHIRMGGLPMLFAHSRVRASVQIYYISILLHRQSSTKAKSALSLSSLKQRTNVSDRCKITYITPFLKNNINKTNRSALQRKYSNCYHTSCTVNGHDPEVTSHEQFKDHGKRNRNAELLIETWFYEVCPHGSLEASLPFKTKVKPLNPHDYPDMNKVIIQLHFDASESTDVPTSNQLSHISDLYDLKVGFDEDKANMKITCDVMKGVIIPLVCTLVVPLKFDLKIQTFNDVDVSVEKMESNAIVIENERGNCNLSNVKCGSMSVLCRSGNINSKSSLLGNVYFLTGKSGNIVADKLQGSNIVCETELGSVAVKSLYANSAIFRSHAGDVQLGQCHGQICMQAEKSHLKIESLDGDLDVGLQSGSAEVHLSRHKKVDINITTGDISLSFPEDTNTDLNLDCPAVTLDENIVVKFAHTRLPHHKEGYIGEKGEAVINARTLSGTIRLKCLDWIETSKLFFKTNGDDT